MTILEIDIKLRIEVPDNRPLVDYVRACGNYLCDKLPAMQEQDTRREWSAGINVTLVSEVEFRKSDATRLISNNGKLIDISDL